MDTPLFDLPNNIKAYIDKLNSEKEYLCAAYLAETGLKPSEVKIIEKRDLHCEFYLQRKDWVGDVETPAMNEARARIAELGRDLETASKTIALLERKLAVATKCIEWYAKLEIEPVGYIGRGIDCGPHARKALEEIK